MTIDLRDAEPALAVQTAQTHLQECLSGDVLQIVGNRSDVLQNLRFWLKEKNIEPKEALLQDEWILGFLVP